MKKSNIIMTSVAALVALVAVTGVAFMSYAQSNASTTPNNFGPRENRWENLTTEQKAQMEADRTAREAEKAARQTEMNTAIAQGYDAWAAWVKKNQGENAPILSKITTENFAKFAEANGYLEKARSIYQELGIEGGFGPGMGLGGPGGGRHGGLGCPGMNQPDDSATSDGSGANGNTL
jgi:hypothetical protein